MSSPSPSPSPSSSSSTTTPPPTWLESSLAFYASYHHEHRNKLIHFFFVWPIFFTAQTFIFQSPLQWTLPPPFSYQVTPCLLLSLTVGLYYFLIEQPGLAGPFASLLVALGYFGNLAVLQYYPLAWKPALAIHLLAWAAQIFGHQVFEKRAPAFLDNLFQALVMAPLFVVIEIFFLLGYKNELRKKIDVIATKNIREFRRKQA
eukprot:gene10919-12134_t